jgi:hypothetical protein
MRGYAQTDSLPNYTSISSTGTYNKTTGTRSYLFSNNLDLKTRKKHTKTNLQLKWLYGMQQSDLTNNDLYAGFDLNLYSNHSAFYYWLLCSYNTSLSLKINNQFQSGAGLAYQLINRNQLQINISDGILYDYSDVDLDDTLRTIYHTPRNSFRFQIKLFLDKRFTLSSVSYIQHSFLNQKDVIIKNENNALFKLKEWISVNIKLQYDKMNRTEKESIFITYGLLLQKSF